VRKRIEQIIGEADRIAEICGYFVDRLPRHEAVRLDALVGEVASIARLVRGEGTTMIASSMGVRVSTARTHVDAVLTKLGVHTRLEAVAHAVREGIVDASAGDWYEAECVGADTTS
jgi:DNA-binding NarL/FixJ family response regulator